MGWATAAFWATWAAIWSAASRGMPSAVPKMEVAMSPGQMALTRIFRGDSSAAAQRLRWITAAFAVE